MIFYIYMFGASLSLKSFSNDYIGSDFIPKVVTAIGFLCTLRVFAEQISITLKEKKAIEAAGGDSRIFKGPTKGQPLGYYVQKYISILTLLLIAIYISLMKPLGFILSTIIYLFAQIMLIAPKDKKKPVFIAILSIVFSIVIYAIFTKGFYVILPAGIFSF